MKKKRKKVDLWCFGFFFFQLFVWKLWAFWVLFFGSPEFFLLMMMTTTTMIL